MNKERLFAAVAAWLVCGTLVSAPAVAGEPAGPSAKKLRVYVEGWLPAMPVLSDVSMAPAPDPEHAPVGVEAPLAALVVAPTLPSTERSPKAALADAAIAGPALAPRPQRVAAVFATGSRADSR